MLSCAQPNGNPILLTPHKLSVIPVAPGASSWPLTFCGAQQDRARNDRTAGLSLEVGVKRTRDKMVQGTSNTSKPVRVKRTVPVVEIVVRTVGTSSGKKALKAPPQSVRTPLKSPSQSQNKTAPVTPKEASASKAVPLTLDTDDDFELSSSHLPIETIASSSVPQPRASEPNVHPSIPQKRKRTDFAFEEQDREGGNKEKERRKTVY
ncbi:hypothetical protein BT69DRAFT_910019 [Atractiella rhizophila]|nr:hypothetical protein BT69DRAFT_910019 [Atractiella rhizophila]